MRRRSPALVAVALALALLPSCSGDGEGPPGFALSLTGTDVQPVRPPAPPFPDDVKAGVMATLNSYLSAAVVQPLRTGRPPSGVEPLFTAAAAPRLAGPDRAALVEDGAQSGNVRKDRADVKLTALTGPAGEVVVVTAQLDVALLVASRAGRLAVARAGEMALVPEANTWRIDSYDLRTQRDSPPPPPPPPAPPPA